MEINCIIVDDEPASRAVLKKYTSDIDVLNLVSECKNAVQAMQAIRDHNIQLMFLDINMPKISGLQLLKSLPAPPKVIFTTAYPEYAIDGFELDAVDYLLKPFSFERFLKAVNKYVSLTSNEAVTEDPIVFLKAEKKLYRIPLKDIIYLEALGDYVKVVFGESFIVVHSTFKDLLDQLTHPNIIRIHRSFAMAIDKLEYIDGNQVVLKGNQLPIGKAFRKNLMNKLGG